MRSPLGLSAAAALVLLGGGISVLATGGDATNPLGGLTSIVEHWGDTPAEAAQAALERKIQLARALLDSGDAPAAQAVIQDVRRKLAEVQVSDPQVIAEQITEIEAAMSTESVGNVGQTGPAWSEHPTLGGNGTSPITGDDNRSGDRSDDRAGGTSSGGSPTSSRASTPSVAGHLPNSTSDNYSVPAGGGSPAESDGGSSGGDTGGGSSGGSVSADPTSAPTTADSSIAPTTSSAPTSTSAEVSSTTADESAGTPSTSPSAASPLPAAGPLVEGPAAGSAAGSPAGNAAGAAAGGAAGSGTDTAAGSPADTAATPSVNASASNSEHSGGRSDEVAQAPTQVPAQAPAQAPEPQRPLAVPDQAG